MFNVTQRLIPFFSSLAATVRTMIGYSITTTPDEIVNNLEMYYGNKIDQYVNKNLLTFTSLDAQNLSFISSEFFYDQNKLLLVNCPNCVDIQSRAFAHCDSLKIINFPNCINIGPYAFISCSNLEIINFPKCETLSYGAFANCQNIKEINFPNCTLVDSSAFQSCYNLTKISLPSCLEIGTSAFQYCSSLTEINLLKCTSLQSGAFLGCRNLKKIIIPILSIPYAGFYHCNNLISLYLLASQVVQYYDAFRSTPISNYSTIAGRQGSIFVPASLINSYKTTSYWSAYADKIFTIEDYPYTQED